jgi:hypothetical protein
MFRIKSAKFCAVYGKESNSRTSQGHDESGMGGAIAGCSQHFRVLEGGLHKHKCIEIIACASLQRYSSRL